MNRPQNKEGVTFYKNIDKTLTKELSLLNKLTKKEFACETDAQSAMNEFADQRQFLGFESSAIVKVPTFSGRGRPKKAEEPSGYHDQIEAEPHTDLEKVKIVKLKVGLFILATNDTESADLTMGE